jgi:hypothetical protein
LQESRTPLIQNLKCKESPGTFCKGCHETEHLQACRKKPRRKALTALRKARDQIIFLHFPPKNRMSSPETTQPAEKQEDRVGALVPLNQLY